MDGKSGALERSDSVFVRAFGNDYTVAEADDVPAGGRPVGDFDSVEPVEEASRKKPAAAQDGFRSDQTHRAADVEMS